MKLRLLTKKLKSGSLKRLSVELTKRVGYKVWRSRFPKPNRINLRYGDCKDKLFQYQWFAANGIPSFPFTTSIEEAKEWAASGKVVVARTLTRASEGKGIVIAETPEQVPKAPVYTLYMKKKKEFRVHVFQDKVVAVLEKRKRKGVEHDTRIRNSANGYVFCRQDVTEPEGIRELAIKAAKVNSSDFSGVDIGYNEKLNQLFVIEVNSAPGMEATTVINYADAVLS